MLLWHATVYDSLATNSKSLTLRFNFFFSDSQDRSLSSYRFSGYFNPECTSGKRLGSFGVLGGFLLALHIQTPGILIYWASGVCILRKENSTGDS